jgi:chromate transporter
VTPNLVALALVFGQLSLVAFGGGNTTLPEMHRYAVEVYHWTTDAEFAAFFALARAAPGPNLMIVPLIGWHVAGWAGMFVAMAGMFGPSSVITLVTLRLWSRFQHQEWRRAVQTGLIPISVGLVAASAALITKASDQEWALAIVTAIVALISVKTRLHPLWLLAAGAAFGWSGFGQ